MDEFISDGVQRDGRFVRLRITPAPGARWTGAVHATVPGGAAEAPVFVSMHAFGEGGAQPTVGIEESRDGVDWTSSDCELRIDSR